MSIEQHDSGDIKQSALETNNKQQNDKFEFDVFISYSHKNPHHAETLLESFNSIDADCKVFYDRSALTTGTFLCPHFSCGHFDLPLSVRSSFRTHRRVIMWLEGQ
jgi:hypothetical protein